MALSLVPILLRVRPPLAKERGDGTSAIPTTPSLLLGLLFYVVVVAGFPGVARRRLGRGSTH